jgi:hypothetical protein
MALLTSWYTGRRVSLVPQYLDSPNVRSSLRCVLELTGISYVHLADELTAESVNDASYGRSGSLADKVEVEHSLHRTRLQPVDKASCLVVEEGVFGSGAQGPAGSHKSADVVVC